MTSIRETIEREVTGWPGVEARGHRFGGVEFRVNGHEIGHLHGDRLADLPFPVRMREELVESGKAQVHHVLPQTGCRWGARPVQDELRAFDGTEGSHGMSAFTEKEIEYLGEQRLGRLATVDGEGRLHSRSVDA